MAVDLTRFELRLVRDMVKQKEGVCLMCLDCGDRVFGEPSDGIGTGDSLDCSLDVIVFQADEHHNLWCKP